MQTLKKQAFDLYLFHRFSMIKFKANKHLGQNTDKPVQLEEGEHFYLGTFGF